MFDLKQLSIACLFPFCIGYRGCSIGHVFKAGGENLYVIMVDDKKKMVRLCLTS